MFALYPKDFDSSFDFCGSLFKSSSSDWNSQIAVWKNQNVKSFCAHKNSLRWKKSKLKFQTIQYFMFVFLTCCAFHFPFHAIWNHTFPQSVLLQRCLYQKLYFNASCMLRNLSRSYTPQTIMITLSFSWLRNCNLFSLYQLPFHDAVDQNRA